MTPGPVCRTLGDGSQEVTAAGQRIGVIRPYGTTRPLRWQARPDAVPLSGILGEDDVQSPGWGWPRRSRAEAVSELAGQWHASQAAALFTSFTRRVIKTAASAGLHPHADMCPAGGRSVRIVVDGPGRDALFGAFYVSPDRGAILYGCFCYGNDDADRRYDGALAVQQVIRSWAASRLAVRNQ